VSAVPPATSDGAGGHEPSRPVPRVGRIGFVNCFPLYLHFEEELAARGVRAEVVTGHPAELNRRLIAGEIDVALPSSIEFARHADRLVLLPTISISSVGAVDSIQLFSKLPRRHITSIALTEQSATSVSLLKILCREWGIAPSFAPRRQLLADTLAHFDALLLIGDEALKVLRTEVYPCHYDLGEEWRAVTGLPMVYAVCAVRREFAAAWPDEAAAIEAALMASRDDCAAHPQETAAAAARLYDFSQEYLEGYFDRLKFGFVDSYRAGLLEFYRRAAAVGELELVPDLATREVSA
jgi:chorismate dehydratase